MHRLSERVVQAIVDERQLGLSTHGIVKALAAKGVKVSVGSVHAVITGTHPVSGKATAAAPASPAKAAPSPGKAAPAPSAEAPKAPAAPKREKPSKGKPEPEAKVPLDGPPEDADIATLDRWILEHEVLAAKAQKDGDLSGYAAVHRLLQRALEARRKFRPPPVPDDGATPDMVKAGADAARRLHELIDRALGVEAPAS